MKSKNTIKDLQDIILKKNKVKKAIPPAKKVKVVAKPQAMAAKKTPVPETAKLEQVHEGKILFKGKLNNYLIMGTLPMDFSSLKVTVVVTEDTSDKRSTYKIDLYEHEEVQLAKESIARLFCIQEELVGADMLQLASLLEKYRDEQVITRKIVLEESGRMSHGEETFARSVLTSYNIMGRIDKLMEQSGIRGQEHIKLLLFLAASSYKSKKPLHVNIGGASDIAHELITRLGRFIPQEERLMLNNVSARSFYHCSHEQLVNKALLLPDGIEKKAAHALKMLYHGETLTTATTTKDKLGDMVSSVKQVKSHFSSIAYAGEQGITDNRIIRVQVDESAAQVEKMVQYQNEKYAGLINDDDEKSASDKLRHIIYCIEAMEVINPYAGKIILPARPENLIAINGLFQALVIQICLLHQYKRKKDKAGRLLAEPLDSSIACDILFKAMVMESDELEGQTSKFFADIKAHIMKKAGDKAKEYWFTMRELRHEMNIPKTSCFRLVDDLHKLEYLERKGHANTGYSYRIIFWDDMEKTRKKMRDTINTQLAKLGVPHTEYISGTPEPNTGRVSTGGVPSAA